MTGFTAELFITYNMNNTIGKFLKIVWHDLLTIKPTDIICIWVVHINSCGSTAS